MTESLEVGGLNFEVRRSSRRKTLGLTVDRGGELVIHSPISTADADLTKWTKSKLLWVHQKLLLKEELAASSREPEFVSGESFCYLGRFYRLQIVSDQVQPLRFDGHCFSLRRDARPAAHDHFRAWYVVVGKTWIENRVRVLADRIGALPARIEVRDLGFRWGSCGKNSAVYFNWKLLQLRVRLADYVLCHELAHLIEPNHQPDFWRLLDRALPDWAERRDELRMSGPELFWCNAEMVQQERR